MNKRTMARQIYLTGPFYTAGVPRYVVKTGEPHAIIEVPRAAMGHAIVRALRALAS